MASLTSFEGVTDAVGSDLGLSDWHTITPEHVAMFAEATNAHEWIHLDMGRARRESPFGTTVAHGYLTLSLATRFSTQVLTVETPTRVSTTAWRASDSQVPSRSDRASGPGEHSRQPIRWVPLFVPL